MDKDKYFFRPRARLLVQLGDQLIRSENIAIVELVKNAYDADAKECEIICENIDDLSSGSITIQDNGCGMTPEVVKNVWLEPGADFKAKIFERGDQAEFDFSVVLPRRVPLGEKGVGRFGAHKLGSRIELVTKSAHSKKEVVIKIDWDDFSKEKYLEEATFLVEERTPVIFTSTKTGTRITMSGLRYTWTAKKYDELTRNINSLKSPFELAGDFKVVQKLSLKDKKKEDRWQTQIIEPEDIRTAALWEASGAVEGDKIIDFKMEFKPWDTLDVDPRTVSLEELKSKGNDELERVLSDSSEGKVNLRDGNIGRFNFHMYVFDLDQKTLGFNPIEKESLKKYLGDNGGVRVYRDGFRIYDYGEPGNDWLGLDKERINNPTKFIGNKNIIGAVMLDRKNSASLVEKTNREGFVENKAYKTFLSAVRYVAYLVGMERGNDKRAILAHLRGDKKVETAPTSYEVSVLEDKVTDVISRTDIKNKDKIIQEISDDFRRIQEQFVNTSQILIKSSNMGLTFGVVVHEVDKRLNSVKNILDTADEDINAADLKNLRELISGIVKLVEGYGAISATDKKVNSLRKTIDIALLNNEFRFDAHGISIVSNYKKTPDQKVKFSLNSTVGILLNLFDNSIYWLNKYQIKDPKIFLTIKHYKDRVGIVVADNGNGFSIDFEDAVKPYYTQKVIGGHGLGLHIANEVMKAQRGNLIQRLPSEVPDLPAEFNNGAIIELVFKV